MNVVDNEAVWNGFEAFPFDVEGELEISTLLLLIQNLVFGF